MSRISNRWGVLSAVISGCVVLHGVGAASAAVAVPAESAFVCHGMPATIVGHPGSQVEGTPGDDVIVSNSARSADGGDGNDLICITGRFVDEIGDARTEVFDGVIEPLWSEMILDEVERNLPKIGISPQAAERRVGRMREAFNPEAGVDDFEHLIEDMACDPKDRHVLAAAVRGGADAIVTFNVRDFPAAAISAVGVQLEHPDSFLLGMLAQAPDEVVDVLAREVSAFTRPPQSVEEFLANLTVTVPLFANMAADAWREPLGPVTDLPAVVESTEEAGLAALGTPGDISNPAQVAVGWWSSLTNDLDLDLARALATTRARGATIGGPSTSSPGSPWPRK